MGGRIMKSKKMMALPVTAAAMAFGLFHGGMAAEIPQLYYSSTGPKSRGNNLLAAEAVTEAKRSRKSQEGRIIGESSDFNR